MELLDRYLLRLALILGLAIYAIASGGVAVATSTGDASLIAAVQRAPVIVGLRLELHRGCLTLAVLAQLRKEQDGYTLSQAPAERTLSIDASAPCSLLRGLKEMTRPQRID